MSSKMKQIEIFSHSGIKNNPTHRSNLVAHLNGFFSEHIKRVGSNMAAPNKYDGILAVLALANYEPSIISGGGLCRKSLVNTRKNNSVMGHRNNGLPVPLFYLGGQYEFT